MRCCQAVRWSTRVLRSRTVVRKSRIHAGGIQEVGSRPCSSSSRSSRASVRSVLARRLGPRRLLVSAGSARYAPSPAACSSSTTNRQPVHPSTANPPSAPGRSPSQARSTARVAGAIRPRRASPLSRSTQSKVIWARCTSSPPIMLIGTSFELRPCGLQHDHPCLSRRGSLHMSSFLWAAPVRPNAVAVKYPWRLACSWSRSSRRRLELGQLQVAHIDDVIAELTVQQLELLAGHEDGRVPAARAGHHGPLLPRPGAGGPV